MELHLICLGIADIFMNLDEYFLPPNKESNGYYFFVYEVFLMIKKLSALESFVMALFLISVLYISFYYIRNKTNLLDFFKGIVINNIIVILSFRVLFFLIEYFFYSINETLIAIVMFFYIMYALYLYIYSTNKRTALTAFFDNFKSSHKEDEKNKNTDNFIFETKSGKINLLNPYRGIYIQGGAGSGKSASIFEPIIKQIGQKEFTGILYDFKSPELTNLVYSCYSSSTVNVKNVDFKRPCLSDRVNPIEPKYLQKSAIAMEYAQVILNNLLPESIKKADFWSNNSKMILAGVIWYLKQQHPNYCTLPHAISLILHSSIDELIEKVSTDFEAGGMVASLRESIERGAERTVAGMLSTLQNALSTLNSHDIFWILSSNEIDLYLNNKENPTFLCLGNDSTLPTIYTPAISLIVSVALRQMNQPNQQKSVVLLDEAPTIFIPNVEQIPATARSNKIATVFGVQDFAQLQDKYGSDKAQVIVSNLGNQFFGRITNGKSAEMVQNLFSKKDHIFVSKNDGSSGKITDILKNDNRGTSEAIQERDRVKISDLINLNQGEFYGIIAEGSPREFLKTQFDRHEIINTYINTKIPVTADMMAENYSKIIEECKSIIE
ncbi:type IV secretory system conjugative DNA transfer family protein [Flavobacterium oreochromis]